MPTRDRRLRERLAARLAGAADVARADRVAPNPYGWFALSDYRPA